MNASGCSSWLTPTASIATDGNANRGGDRADELLLTGQARQWPTPVVTDAASAARGTTTTGVMHSGTTLTDAMRAWPTPTARDGDNRGATGTQTQAWKNKVARGSVNRSGLLSDDLKSAAAAMYPTPKAATYGSSQNGINGKGGTFERPSAGTASLMTMARTGELDRRIADAIGGDAGLPWSGELRLNPRFTEWMMGMPSGAAAVDDTPNEWWDQLHAIGNGVVRYAAAAAVVVLLERIRS